MLEILSEAGKKDEVFSETYTREFDKHNGTTGLPHIDDLKKIIMVSLILNILLKLVEQCVILVGQCHSRGSYVRNQRVLIALFKYRRNVKSL